MRSLACVILLLLLAGCGGEDRPTAEEPVAAEESTVGDEPAICTANPKDSVTVRAKFKPGDTRTIEVVKKRTENGKERESTSTATLEVLDRRRLRWTAHDVVIAPGIPAQDFTMEYSIDRDGAYARLENLDEVRAMARRIIDALEKDTAGLPAAAEKRIRRLLLSEAFLQNALTQDISTLHGVYGAHLKGARRSRRRPSCPTRSEGGRSRRARRSRTAARTTTAAR